jgi:hypothetical protein
VNARRVHAVLAAGVQNPALIEAWRRDPALLRGHGIEPAEIDLDALWKFAGLSLKVRHNGIREDLPLTFRLLHVAELAIDAFASYAARRAGEGGRLGDTAEARARDFVEFLSGWLDLARTPHALLWDMVRHERALAQLARAPARAPASGPRPPGPRALGRAVPRLREGLVFHAMQSDPRAVAARLRERAPRLDDVALEPCCACYWRNGEEAAIARLDAPVHDLLALVDGERTAAELGRALLGGDRVTPGFARLLRELAALGVLELGPRR